MGIWDYFSSATGSVKKHAPDLTSVVNKVNTAVPANAMAGVWGYVSSAADSVKQNTPDLTPVKNLYQSSCSYGWSAVTKVDNAVRVNAVEKLNQYCPDEQARSEFARFTAAVVKNTGAFVIEEGVKSVPGGAPAYKIVLKSLHRDKKPENHKEEREREIKELHARIDRLEKERYGSAKLHDQAEVQKPDLGLKSGNTFHSDSTVNQSPEDVIRVFMMKEFIGARILDDLMVLKVGHRKKSGA